MGEFFNTHRKHGHRFGAVDEYDYERMADCFMAMPLHANLFECVNPTGDRDRNRIEGGTHIFGVAYNVSILRTFHIRDAASIARAGGPMAWVLQKCAKIY